MIRSFPPIINSETEILIIGTMPSVKSLEAQQYYAHPRNAFWKIIAALYHQGAEFADFQEKKACLLANRLGLWDSLQLCLREGSLDSAITDEQPNDFNTLLAEHPAVRRLLFNGQPAFKFFKNIMPLSCCGQSIIFCLQPVRPMPLIRWMTKSESGLLI